MIILRLAAFLDAYARLPSEERQQTQKSLKLLCEYQNPIRQQFTEWVTSSAYRIIRKSVLFLNPHGKDLLQHMSNNMMRHIDRPSITNLSALISKFFTN